MQRVELSCLAAAAAAAAAAGEGKMRNEGGELRHSPARQKLHSFAPSCMGCTGGEGEG